MRSRLQSRTTALFLALLVVGAALATLMLSGHPLEVATIPPAGPTSSAVIASPTAASLRRGSGAALGVWLGSGNQQAVDLLKASGARWTYIVMSWAAIEPRRTDPPTYNFALYDRLLRSLGEAGINTIVDVRQNPDWAASTFCGPLDKGGGLEAYGQFLAAAARHYGAPPYNVKHWELYNEPDATDLVLAKQIGMACFGMYPKQYVDVLQVASAAVKGVDPEAKIVFGGLAHENPPFHFNLDFFDEVLSAGGGDFFDVANVHYYSSQDYNWSSYGQDIAGKVGKIRKTMARHKVDKPVAVTELNWTSGPENGPQLLENQARYLLKVLARGMAIDLYAITWFMLVDEKADSWPNGLLDFARQPRPAYRAFQTLARELGEATFVRALSPADVGAAGVEGYVFDVAGQERWILWASADGGQVEIHLPSRTAEILDRSGQPLSPAAGTFRVGDDPVYLRLGP